MEQKKQNGKYEDDIWRILAKRGDNGGDLWATGDRRLIKGSPFSTLESAALLAELGMDPGEPVLQDTAELIFSTQREDGRFRLVPGGAIYPCQTIHAAQVLCALGHAQDPRLEKTYRHLLETRYRDGGWRCNKFSYGRGPETEFSNPGPTLMALDAFRHKGYGSSHELDTAVEFLLGHWETRTPLGPCHYGIGTLFMQVEYPFLSYNLFYYTFVLSFYRRAASDSRYLAALTALEERMEGGQIVVQRVNRKLADFGFCRKGVVSDKGTERYLELKRNLSEWGR